jgi:NADH-quinone oxidoreductase subunit N
MMALTDVVTILPLIVLVAWGMLLLLVDLWIPAERKGITALLAAIGLLAAMAVTIAQAGVSATVFSGMVTVDGFAQFLDVLFLLSGVIGIALANDYIKRTHIERGEYYSLLMFAIAGMILMTYANDLIVVFLALELLSIPLYILAGFARLHPESEEAALKYFLIGSFSSGFVLYGIALIYGATAGTSLPAIVAAVAGAKANLSLLLIGAALLLVGFSFKAAIVPFHMWTPDVYQGAPSSVTAFMTVGAKAAGFAALMRVFITALPTLSASLTPVLWGLAALTMVIGNIVAIAQTNMKRLLAYASIAQSGYMLMAFVPFANGQVQKNTIAAMLFYLAAYSLTTLGAWAIVIALEKEEGRGLAVEDYAGLGRKHPYLALAMSVFMLSFTGIPLTLGFWGKLYLFNTVVQGGFLSLAVIGLLTSVVSAYYYLRVIVVMFMRPGEPDVVRDPWVNLTAIGSAVAVLGLSFFPGPLLELAARAVLKLL